MSVDRTKGMRFPRQPSSLQIALEQSRLKIVENFNCGLLDAIIHMKMNLVFPWQK